jgi:hypothetical protein
MSSYRKDWLKGRKRLLPQLISARNWRNGSRSWKGFLLSGPLWNENLQTRLKPEVTRSIHWSRSSSRRIKRYPLGYSRLPPLRTRRSRPSKTWPRSSNWTLRSRIEMRKSSDFPNCSKSGSQRTSNFRQASRIYSCYMSKTMPNTSWCSRSTKESYARQGPNWINTHRSLASTRNSWSFTTQSRRHRTSSRNRSSRSSIN